MAVVACKDCQQKFSADAKYCPHCGAKAQQKRYNWLKYLGVFILVIVVLKALPDTKNDHQNFSGESTLNDADLLLSRCGTPEVDDSTAHDHPRPPIVTRWMIYKKANTEIMFAPGNGKVGDPPPYYWKLIGALDPKKKQPLKAEELIRRLPCFHS